MARGVRDRAVCPRRWALAAWALVLAAPASSSAAQAPAAPANPATPPATDAPGRLPGASQLQGPADPLVEGPAAAPGQLQGPSGVSAEGPAAPAVATKPSERWIKRFRPKERHRLELGVFGGVFLPNARHELYEPAKATWAPYARVAGAIGLRVAYLPIPYVGAELDAAVMPVALDATYVSSGGRANLYALRGHVIAQLPLASVVPFVLLGGGGLGARSDVLGSDLDLASHFGGGLKVFVHRRVGVRLDVRGTVTSRQGTVGSRIVHPEVLLGIVIPLGLQPRDSDGDGSYDPDQRRPPVDRCPDVAGAVPMGGCPDSDRDTVPEPDDRCPGVVGLSERRGCPALRDSDRDSVYDPGQIDIPPPGEDRCPQIAGLPAYLGCPPPDGDGDGVPDPDDKCVDVRETDNGFQDDDGCPDEVPIDLKEVIGALRSINFSFMSDVISDSSKPELDHTVEIMRKYPTIRVEIQGHTDDEGDPAVNLELSLRRALAVRRYFSAAGIAEARMNARGYGGTKPVVDNKTEAGKARNRRIEVRLIDANDRLIKVPP